MTSRPIAREPFTRTQSPGCEHAAKKGEPLLDRRGPARHGDAARAREVAAGEGADGDEHLHPGPGGGGADLLVVGGSAGPQLGHVAEDRHLPAVDGPLREVLERGRHGERVRVVAVVQKHAPAGERHLLAAQARELDVPRALLELAEGKAERVVGGDRGEGVRRVVSRAEAELERQRPAERLDLDPRAAVPRGEVRQGDVAAVPEASDLDVRAAEVRLQVGLARGDDRRPAGRQALDQLRLRLRDALDRPEELEVNRADTRHDADVGSRDLAQLRDLTEAPHAHLDDRDLGVLLEPAQGQREPDLVVLTSLGDHRGDVRRAEGAEDVLRRRLRRRAGDRDHLRPRAFPHGAAERGERAEGVLGDERRRRAGGERVLDERHAAADGDEEISGTGAAGIDDDAGDELGTLGPRESSGRELLDLVECERDHAAAPSRRRASRATSRSSNGIVRSRNSCPCS